MLINGLLCLAAAALLLYAIMKVQDYETSQFLQKFMWLYFCILLLIGVHHTVISLFQVRNDTLFEVINGLYPLADIMNAVGGSVLAMWLLNRYRQYKMVRRSPKIVI